VIDHREDMWQKPFVRKNDAIPFIFPGKDFVTEYVPAADQEVAKMPSAVADFHRNLLAGGVFAYQADSRDPAKPHGKLRLMYEAIPLVFLAEQADGLASDGPQNILYIPL